MKTNISIPTICIQCRWFNVLGCMYNGELRKDFNPGITCFMPKNDLTYPNPKNIVKKFFDICYKSFSKLEYEFIINDGEFKDGTKFLSVLSDNIRILEKRTNKTSFLLR